jgi:hypothetical protein
MPLNSNFKGVMAQAVVQNSNQKFHPNEEFIGDAHLKWLAKRGDELRKKWILTTLHNDPSISLPQPKKTKPNGQMVGDLQFLEELNNGTPFCDSPEYAQSNSDEEPDVDQEEFAKFKYDSKMEWLKRNPQARTTPIPLKLPPGELIFLEKV